MTMFGHKWSLNNSHSDMFDIIRRNNLVIMKTWGLNNYSLQWERRTRKPQGPWNYFNNNKRNYRWVVEQDFQWNFQGNATWFFCIVLWHEWLNKACLSMAWKICCIPHKLWNIWHYKIGQGMWHCMWVVEV